MKTKFPTPDQPVLLLGDNLKAIKQYPDNSIHAVVTDAPYGLNSKEHNIVELVQKYLNGESYTLGGKGFVNQEWDSDLPTFDLIKEILRVLKPGGYLVCFSSTRTYDILALTVRWAGFRIRDQMIWAYTSGVPKGEWLDKKMQGHPLAHLFNGKNESLKPAFEPIVLAQKPLDTKDIVENILKHQTGALNIKSVEVEREDDTTRYPANIITDGSPTISNSFNGANEFFNICSKNALDEHLDPILYFSKSSDTDKDFGLDQYTPEQYRKAVISGNETKIKNPHPTVKPIALMRHLIRLVSGPGDTVLDCFLGSGTTGIAACLEGRNFIGMEIEQEYFRVAELRISRAIELSKKYQTKNWEIIANRLELDNLEETLASLADQIKKDPSNPELVSKVSDLLKRKRQIQYKSKKNMPMAA